MRTATPRAPVEPSLEDAWAHQLVNRYPRILHTLDDAHPLDLSELHHGRAAGGLDPVYDAVREYELVCRSDQLENVDEARLFEAVVVRLSYNLLANDKDRALTAYEYLEALPAREVGIAYRRRLGTVIEHDASQVHTDEVGPDGVERDRDLEIAKMVAERLRELDAEEASTGYSEVKRRSLLLLFCAALWSVESRKSTAAADLALDDRFRRALTGDAIALFFRARALLVSPVASGAQTELGLQFVTTALSYFPNNPGMHHTRALFLLRKSSTIVGEAESMECLEQALTSVEEALKWDAELAVFYATRAKVKYRMHNRSGALVDIRAAIELARYGTLSRHAARDIGTWEALLEGWDLAPVGVASGGGA
jgi:hypothetical protein